jgi:flagellar hook-associated protein 3 FlgL
MSFDPNYINTLSSALDQSSSAEDRLSNELASNLRVLSLQDDPAAVAQSSMMATTISQDDTFVQTASGAESKLQVADSTLGEVVSQLTSALSLAVSGGNGTLNASDLRSIAQQLTGIRDQVLTLANTSYLGQSLFAGSQGSVKPFSLDTSTNPATVSYAGDSTLNYVETPSGQKIATNIAGSDVFGSGSTGVLGALNQLISDFSGSTASSSAADDTATLSAALSNLSAQRTVLDSSLSRLQATSTYTQTEEGQLQALQGSLVSADPASIATQLSSAEVQRQSLMSVITALQKTNLFDYLQ